MYNTSNLNSMKRIVYMLAVLFYGTSLFAQDKPFDIEHAPAPLFRCPIYDGPTAVSYTHLRAHETKAN